MLVENEPKAAKEAAGEGKSKTSVGKTEEPQRKKFTRETDINPFGPMRYDGMGWDRIARRLCCWILCVVKMDLPETVFFP